MGCLLGVFLGDLGFGLGLGLGESFLYFILQSFALCPSFLHMKHTRSLPCVGIYRPTRNFQASLPESSSQFGWSSGHFARMCPLFPHPLQIFNQSNLFSFSFPNLSRRTSALLACENASSKVLGCALTTSSRNRGLLKASLKNSASCASVAGSFLLFVSGYATLANTPIRPSKWAIVSSLICPTNDRAASFRLEWLPKCLWMSCSIIFQVVWALYLSKYSPIHSEAAPSVYLSLPPTRHDLTHSQKPEGRLKWG